MSNNLITGKYCEHPKRYGGTDCNALNAVHCLHCGYFVFCDIYRQRPKRIKTRLGSRFLRLKQCIKDTAKARKDGSFYKCD